MIVFLPYNSLQIQTKKMIKRKTNFHVESKCNTEKTLATRTSAQKYFKPKINTWTTYLSL